jgi:hypothetical protein
MVLCKHEKSHWEEKIACQARAAERTENSDAALTPLPISSARLQDCTHLLDGKALAVAWQAAHAMHRRRKVLDPPVRTQCDKKPRNPQWKGAVPEWHYLFRLEQVPLTCIVIT